MDRSAWWTVVFVIGIVGIGREESAAVTADGFEPGEHPPGLGRLGRRAGPKRRVVDQVCLVPDVPTFLEAIAAWDEAHCFPILIDDVELTFKFLRAFRPARIVRYPAQGRARSRPTGSGTRPSRPVGRSWSADGGRRPRPRAGRCRPETARADPARGRRLGARQPDARRRRRPGRRAVPAAGPLGDRPGGSPTSSPPTRPAPGTRAWKPRSPTGSRDYGQLGDDCDFLTLAGDWPYRYQRQGRDGRLRRPGRPGADGQRRAGRSPAGCSATPTASVYRAMCSLFLQPESALLFNTYTDAGPPWTDYALTRRPQRLARLAAGRRSARGTAPSLAGLAPASSTRSTAFGLVLINTHGGPTQFHLAGRAGPDGRRPAERAGGRPDDPQLLRRRPDRPGTIAGRWLANGAFVYFGSMNEPFLQSFRPPGLVAALLAEGVPLGGGDAAVAPRAVRPALAAGLPRRPPLPAPRRRPAPARRLGRGQVVAELRAEAEPRPGRARTTTGWPGRSRWRSCGRPGMPGRPGPRSRTSSA